MSSSLLKKSLEIVDSSFREINNKKAPKRNPFDPSAPVPKLNSINKSKKKKNKNISNTLKQQKSTKSAIQLAHERLRQNETKSSENLKKLLSYSSNKLDADTTEKLIQRAQTGKYVIPRAETKKEVESVFTDEDFAKFEKEYFCN